LARAQAARNRFWRYSFALLLLVVIVHFWR
jgi:hypothetical protein